MSRDPKKPPEEPSFHSPFAVLEGLRGRLPPGAAPAPLPPVVPKGPARAVVRREKKGRGGKEVTLVEQLGLPSLELEVWLKALKAQLGCGGAVEGNALVLQGDQRERARAALETRGVRRVILS